MSKPYRKLTKSEVGKLAAKARHLKLSAEQRTEIARAAGKARWAGLSKAERTKLAARGGKASAGVSKTKRSKL